MSNRKVGQIIYIMSQSEMTLTPVMIIEEVVRRTLDGETISHIVEMVGQNGAKKKFSLSDEKFHTFDTIDIARNYLIENATNAIDVMCEQAKKKSLVFAQAVHQDSQQNLQKNNVHLHENVILEDGTRVKINIPQEA